ncbi:MAG: hypothetical protein A3F18_08315 [Legionellales bacterium RIFCSPHIGHO2_12_FULL_37_14]|nr:MAG: hypothetical protein A3F18_08315 [Legionellales bacterium RIFCSPHIGHO2_12_FULL_37_14]
MSNNDNDNEISEEDKALFRKMVGEIRHVKSREYAKEKPDLNLPLNLTDIFSYKISAEEKLKFYRNPLTKRQNTAFIKGQLPIENSLDLHGLTIDEAKSALLRFIHASFNRQKRSLLIIHGKGRRHGEAKLKNLVNHWLPQFTEVLAFVSAEPKDGGAGAIYVLLKRNTFA